ncbi:NUDIX hydrolase [Actinokineospora guangxiensis]|uniref:NUDIX hydrolase n=1 Tax=Actinokineospora guangxiensis TaxID=1490288 RepID=A0ABW0EIX8_9PSEU
MSAPKHSVSVAGIIVNQDGRVLLTQRRDNDNWEPPGGVLELNETMEEGLRREVLEETRLHVSVDQLTGVYKNMARGIVAVVFRCTPRAGSLSPTDEVKRLNWATLDEAALMVPPVYFVRVRDAFSGRARFRAHDGVTIFPSS